MSVEIRVPTLGESVTEATVSTWFKKVGDAVAQDEMLCELETDKVSVEVPAPAAGVLTEILAAEGDTVAAGGGASWLQAATSSAAAPIQSFFTLAPLVRDEESGTSRAPKNSMSVRLRRRGSPPSGRSSR